jgi:hypothetical protein
MRAIALLLVGACGSASEPGPPAPPNGSDSIPVERSSKDPPQAKTVTKGKQREAMERLMAPPRPGEPFLDDAEVDALVAQATADDDTAGENDRKRPAPVRMSSPPPGTPQGKVTIENIVAKSSTSLTSFFVMDRISHVHQHEILRCYRAHLAKDATARGTVQLRLEVTRTGSTRAGGASGFPAAEVNECLSALMGTWFFPSPRNSRDKPVEAWFVLTLALAPS